MVDKPYPFEDDEYSEGGWIQWFINLEGHEFFWEVDEDYIRDNFNLYGLRHKISRYRDALEMILCSEAPDEYDLQDEHFLEVYRESVDLYGLVHARFILSPRGLAMMREKYIAGRFGTCPRVVWEKQNVLPIGMSEELRSSRVKVFCPRCEEAYIPKKKFCDVDGAYFGSSFPHFLLQTYPDLYPNPARAEYIPKIFGFRVFNRKGSKIKQGEPEPPISE